MLSFLKTPRPTSNCGAPVVEDMPSTEVPGVRCRPVALLVSGLGGGGYSLSDAGAELVLPPTWPFPHPWFCPVGLGGSAGGSIALNPSQLAPPVLLPTSHPDISGYRICKYIEEMLVSFNVSLPSLPFSRDPRALCMEEILHPDEIGMSTDLLHLFQPWTQISTRALSQLAPVFPRLSGKDVWGGGQCVGHRCQQHEVD